MRKYFLPIALILLLAGSASYAWMGAGQMAGSVPSAAPAPTYLFEESFDPTGTDLTWVTVTGTPDYDYTTTILEGAQSFFLDGTVTSSRVYTAITAIGEIWVYFLYRPVALAGGDRTFFSLYNGTVAVSNVQIGSDGTLYITQGSGTARTVGAMSTGTTYKVWVHHKAESAASAVDGVIEVGFSTDGVRPTSGDNYAISSSGSNEATISRVALVSLLSTTGISGIFDKLRGDDVQIGDNPQ